jgi:hypothetical protein
MINKQNHIAWSQFIYELEDAKEHLENLLKEIQADGEYGEEELRVDLGHVYAHLNRAWNSRNTEKEINEKEWENNSKFPVDIEPVG